MCLLTRPEEQRARDEHRDGDEQERSPQRATEMGRDAEAERTDGITNVAPEAIDAKDRARGSLSDWLTIRLLLLGCDHRTVAPFRTKDESCDGRAPETAFALIDSPLISVHMISLLIIFRCG